MTRARTFLLVAALAATGATATVVEPALSQRPSAPTPSSLVYVVVAGDSLTVVANKLHVTLADLLAVNHLQRTSVIHPGTRLTVPAGGTLPTTPVAPTLTYTVVPADSLIGISSKLHVTLTQLLTTNHLTVQSVIHAGATLLVPAGGTLPTTTSTTSTTTSPPTSTLTYTVLSGDSLTGISLKLKVSLSLLLSTNRLQRSTVIHPGTTLLVPPGGSLPNTTTTTTTTVPAGNGQVYVVRSGDFLIGIAALLRVSLDVLLATNSLTRQSLIYPGKRLVVPVGGHLPDSGPGSIATTGVAKIDAVLAFARAQLGEPYTFNAVGPDTWDCSGLTLAAYAQVGVSLPHYSGAQAILGVRVDWGNEAIRPGDLVFLESSPGSGIINHVGIAISATQWIHAPRTGDVVKIGNINFGRVAAVRRFVQP